MATDNMDLSFIKCPACQSLAPAISKRCRMCGASLHAEGDSGAEQKKAGRVRQRTVSSQSGEVGDALSEVRGSFVPPAKNGPATADAPDPLGEYLAEDDFELPSQPAKVTPINAASNGVKAPQFEEPVPTPQPEVRREPERQREVAQLVENVARTTPAAPPPQPKAVKAQSPRRDESVAGRLIGWLVSYEDPAGSAFEIREGKFFVSRSQIKGQNDFIIEHESISSPHAMLRSAPGKLMVQDLMSERGVFRRPRGTEVYRAEEEPFALEHGDWVRFGDIEYLVSLVAHVGEV
jgi:hypothetical protein